MDRPQVPALHPAHLPPGTVVGPWRVVAWANRGVHGAVYRAVRVGHEHTEPVALKLALFPSDPRFAREVSLLSRTHHPSVPRLLDHGVWRHPFGSTHPYLTMEWVEGVPLYAWAVQRAPSSAQVMRLFAQLARRPWLKTTAAVLALASWVAWLTPGAPVQKPSVAQSDPGRASQQDGGTSGLGEAASTASTEEAPPLFFQEGMAEYPLPEPVEGQATPDAKGRCPRKGQVSLNEGCWAPLKVEREACETANGQMYKDRCYVPVFPPGRRQPTSHPTPQK
jgi:hypothetical protein